MKARQRAEARQRELTQLERLLGSDDAPMRAAEISHRMAVSPRTARRRIDELHESGIAVAFHRGARDGWILERVLRARNSAGEGEA